MGGWEEVIIKLISAEAEVEALLGLAELGNYAEIILKFSEIDSVLIKCPNIISIQDQFNLTDMIPYCWC